MVLKDENFVIMYTIQLLFPDLSGKEKQAKLEHVRSNLAGFIERLKALETKEIIYLEGECKPN